MALPHDKFLTLFNFIYGDISASIHQLADGYMRENQNDPYASSRALIKWQSSKCAVAGLMTGMGGIMTLPVTVPMDMLTNYYIQIRMLSAIAYLHGHDLKSDKVRTMIYFCLVGDGVKELIKKAGVMAGKSVTKKMICKIGKKKTIHLMKFMPVLSGVVGGGMDAYYCHKMGEFALEIFGQSDFEDAA